MDLSAETFLSVCFISSMEDLGMTKIALMIHYVLTKWNYLYSKFYR